jgi:rubrerythrin
MDEQLKVIEILQSALQLEIDGKAFYEEASRQMNDTLGKELFQWLAKQEDNHRRKFQQIYSTIKDNKSWPDMDTKPVDKKRVETMFSKALANLKQGKALPATEVGIIDKALAMEHKTYDIYLERSKAGLSGTEKGFYQSLASEENAHYMYLIDYKEYVADPVNYFTKSEKHSMDAGG